MTKTVNNRRKKKINETSFLSYVSEIFEIPTNWVGKISMILRQHRKTRTTRRKQTRQLFILFFQIMLFPCFNSVNLLENDASIGAKQAYHSHKFFWMMLDYRSISFDWYWYTIETQTPLGDTMILTDRYATSDELNHWASLTKFATNLQDAQSFQFFRNNPVFSR